MGIPSSFTPTTPSSINPTKTFTIPVCTSGGGGKEDHCAFQPAPAAVVKLNVFVGINVDEEKDKFKFKWELEEEVLYA